jgi:histidinol dehydrogenase
MASKTTRSAGRSSGRQAKQSGKLLTVLKSDDSGFESAYGELCDREAVAAAAAKDLRKVLDGVREGGDADLLARVQRADRSKIESLEVDREEWDQACEDVGAAERAALGKAAMRVREFHRKRIQSSWEMREEGGGYFGHRVRALDRVGIYVDAASLRAPSSVIMNTVPASVVEVPEIVLTVSAGRDGLVAPAILTAARVAGVHRVFKAGGAPGIAALAYGTETIPAVDKIVGTGEPAAEAAKLAVAGRVAVMPGTGAGELCIVADRSATPAWIAADLLSQAEQDEAGRILLITHTKALVTRIQEQLAKQVKVLERAKIARECLSSRGAVVVTRNLQESITLANRYAPERLVLALEDPDGALKTVFNAGSVFLGHYTPVAVGDYLAGPNSVLPTGGTARFASPLGVEDFLKRTSFIRFEPPKLRELGAEAMKLAELEGFEGHSAAIDLRLQKIRRARREREAAREAEI